MLIAAAAVHLTLLVLLAANLVYLRGPRAAADRSADLPSMSVLIPARNEADNLRRLLPQLLEQEYPDLDIVIYDDGSEDETPDVLEGIDDARVKRLRGEGVPAGWIGKVHALYQATRKAEGDLYLFLDADASLSDRHALERLTTRLLALPEDSVLTGMTRLRGGGLLLVSLVPNAVLTTLPWPAVRRFRFRSLGALNGQCWLIRRRHYHQFEPHQAFPAEVLEDVQIGRYLLANGLVPRLVDVREEVRVDMYQSHAEAWRGFRKNAYLLMGGHPAPFFGTFILFLLVFIVAPLTHPGFLLSLYLLKTMTDRVARMPVWVTILTPVSYLAAVILQADSAFHHWTGRVAWKGRRVGSQRKS